MSVESMFSLKGKIALVTGGAGGIGFACAEALAEAGAELILVGRTQKSLDEAKSKCDAKGYKCTTVSCDVSSTSDIDRLMEVVREVGGVDVFVNSAAITNRKKLLDMTNEEWDKIMSVNLYGAYYIGKAVANEMIAQGRGGRMIYIVSTGAYRASVSYGAYSASKAAVVMMVKTFALELAEYNILCNLIAPTATDTAFVADYYAANPDRKAAVIKNHPLGRIAVPDDYKGTVLYLATEASAFTTGEMIVVDGGKTAK